MVANASAQKAIVLEAAMMWSMYHLCGQDTACCVGNGDDAAEGGHPICAQCGCGTQALPQALPPAGSFHERSTPSNSCELSQLSPISR